MYYSSIIIWLIPPIRQYKNRYFFFFLFLALADPIVLISNNVFHQDFITKIIYSSTSYLMIISLLKWQSVRKYSLLIVITLLVLILLNILITSSNFYFAIVASCFSIIILMLLKNFIVSYADQRKIDLFVLMLLFYLSTMILKVFNFLIGFADATAFFYITTIFQILFGLFFSIFRENNPKLTIQY